MTDPEQLEPRIYSGIPRRRTIFEPVNWLAERAAENERQRQGAEPDAENG